MDRLIWKLCSDSLLPLTLLLLSQDGIEKLQSTWSFSVMSVSVVGVSDVEQVSDLLDRTTRLFYFSELLWSTKYGTKTFNAVYPKVLDKITNCI